MEVSRDRHASPRGGSRDGRSSPDVTAIVCELLRASASGQEARFDAPLRHSTVASVLSTAARSKLDGTIGTALEAAADETCREALREYLRVRKRETMTKNSAGIEAALEVDLLLRARGIAYAVLKGPTQQQRLYGDLFGRPSGDVDVLVGPGDFAAAQETLKAADFVRTPSGPSLWWDKFLGERHFVGSASPPRVVDLHHRLQQPGSPQPRSCRAFLDRAEPYRIRNTELSVVARTDIPLLSAMSLVKAFFNREHCGSHAFDLLVAVGAEGNDAAARLVERAENEGVAGTMKLALHAVEALFSATIENEAAGTSSGIAAETLRSMVVAPDEVLRWPRRRRILVQACGGSPLRVVREWAWLAASETARRLDRSGAPASAEMPGAAGGHGR